MISPTRLRSPVVVFLVCGGIACCAPRTRPDPDGNQRPLPDPYLIELIAGENAWLARYPDAEGRRGLGKAVASGGEIHVPGDVRIELILTSMDYVYLVSVPELGLREIAVPELEFRIEFRPVADGRYDVDGAHLCGDPDAENPMQLVIERPEQFQSWLRR